MAGINDYSNTAGSNTTINGIDIAEGCSPAGINNAIRQLMADIADVDDGVVPLQTPDINGGTIDGATIGGSSTIDNSIIGGTTPAAGTFTTLTANTSITGTLNTAAQTNITSVGTLSALTVSGDLTVDTNTLYVDSANNEVGIGTTSPSTTLDVAGIGTFKPSATTSLKLINSALNSGSSSGTTGLYLGDASSGINVLTREKSAINGASVVIYGENGFNVQQERLKLNVNSTVLSTGNNERMSWTNSEAVINDQSNDYDFRVESNNASHMLFVDGGNDRVGIRNSTPSGELHIGSSTSSGDTNLYVQSVSTSRPKLRLWSGTASKLEFSVGSTADIGTTTNHPLIFDTNNTERMRIEQGGDVGIGTTNPTTKLEVNGTVKATAFQGDGSALTGVGTNTPSFFVYRDSNQSISSATYTKVQFNAEDIDTDSAYDNSTNYRFTVPSGKDGKYFIFTTVEGSALSPSQLKYINVVIYKNGSVYINHTMHFENNNAQQSHGNTYAIMDLVAGDYLEVYMRIADSSGSPQINGAASRKSCFGGYRMVE